MKNTADYNSILHARSVHRVDLLSTDRIHPNGTEKLVNFARNLFEYNPISVPTWVKNSREWLQPLSDNLTLHNIPLAQEFLEYATTLHKDSRVQPLENICLCSEFGKVGELVGASFAWWLLQRSLENGHGHEPTDYVLINLLNELISTSTTQINNQTNYPSSLLVDLTTKLASGVSPRHIFMLSADTYRDLSLNVSSNKLPQASVEIALDSLPNNADCENCLRPHNLMYLMHNLVHEIREVGILSLLELYDSMNSISLPQRKQVQLLASLSLGNISPDEYYRSMAALGLWYEN